MKKFELRDLVGETIIGINSGGEYLILELLSGGSPVGIPIAEPIKMSTEIQLDIPRVTPSNGMMLDPNLTFEDDGDTEEQDPHRDCMQWPNCDLYGCGEKDHFTGHKG